MKRMPEWDLLCGRHGEYIIVQRTGLEMDVWRDAQDSGARPVIIAPADPICARCTCTCNLDCFTRIH